MKRETSVRFGRISVSVLYFLAIVLLLTLKAHALVGPRSYTNTDTGDVFLGGDYIELGLSHAGSFGTTSGDGDCEDAEIIPSSLPDGFFGALDDGRNPRVNIGMSTNPAGFGVAPDLRMDYFLPGSPNERWDVGYTFNGDQFTGSNALEECPVDIPDNTVTDQSSGDLLKATSEGTYNDVLKTTQVVSFNSGDKFFKNQVTLKNVSDHTISRVRYMRNVDPDNTEDIGGEESFTTRNKILNTFAAGDGKAVVVADTSWNNDDPVFQAIGSRAPLLYFSNDSRARVSTYGFDNENPYDSEAYNAAQAKGTEVTDDIAINIDFDVGTLAPGQSTTLTYYTSLDSGNINSILDTIENTISHDSDHIASSTENDGPNGGDGNDDGTRDSDQNSVATLPNIVVGGGKYETIQVTGGCTTITGVSVKSLSQVGSDGDFIYPVGLTHYTLACASHGDTANIKLFYDKNYNTTGWKARKFIGGKFEDIPGAHFGSAHIGSKTVTTLSYSVTDGGSLDADGSANGTIVDPAGPAVIDTGAPNTGLQSQNKLILLSPLLVGAVLVLAGVSARRFNQKDSIN